MNECREHRKYQLIINEEQAEIIMKALDVFSRISCGQFDIAMDEIFGYPRADVSATLPAELMVPLTNENMDQQLYVMTDKPAIFVRNAVNGFPVEIPNTSQYHWWVRLYTRPLIQALKEAFFPEMSPGMYWPIAGERAGEAAHVAYDTLQVIRHHIAWEGKGWPEKRDWGTMLGFVYDDPLVTSKQPLPEMKTINPKEKEPKPLKNVLRPIGGTGAKTRIIPRPVGKEIPGNQFGP